MMRVCRFMSVCLTRTSSLSREQRGLGRPKLAQRYPTSHVTRTPLSRSKGQRSTCRGAASRTACYIHRMWTKTPVCRCFKQQLYNINTFSTNYPKTGAAGQAQMGTYRRSPGHCIFIAKVCITSCRRAGGRHDMPPLLQIDNIYSIYSPGGTCSGMLAIEDISNKLTFDLLILKVVS